MPAPAPQHGPHQSPPGVMPSQRLRMDGISSSDRNFAMAIHLSIMAGLATGGALIFAPLVLWLIRKDESSYVDDHGREVINMMLTAMIMGLLNITIIWIPVSLIWAIIIFVNVIRGGVAASNGEYFRYPMIFRFLS